MMNKNNKAKVEKQYVVNTYAGWAEPKYNTQILTFEEIQNLPKVNPGVEIEEIFELGKEVKLTMSIA